MIRGSLRSRPSAKLLELPAMMRYSSLRWITRADFVEETDVHGSANLDYIFCSSNVTVYFGLSGVCPARLERRCKSKICC